MATKKEEVVKTPKIEVEVLKGFGKKFNSESIKDGSKLKLRPATAAKLLAKKYVKKA